MLEGGPGLENASAIGKISCVYWCKIQGDLEEARWGGLGGERPKRRLEWSGVGWVGVGWRNEQGTQNTYAFMDFDRGGN